MTSFKDTRSLPYNAKLINSIILDVEKYPDFLPWCKDATILSKSDKEIVAELCISFKLFTRSYKSLITTNEDDKNFFINVNAISGPFKKLVTLWTIEKLDNGCKLSFFIDFEFKSMIENKAMGALFSIATEKMIRAFESRALLLSKASVL